MEMFIDGAWVAAKSDHTDPVRNPATGAIIGTMPRAAADLAKGLALCEGMETGPVWMNDIQRTSHYTPFAGVKQSGIGREKGRWGVEAYLEYKTIYLSYEVPQ